MILEPRRGFYRVLSLDVVFIMAKKTQKYWKTKIDKVYHEYIRRRDADDQTGFCSCVTCQKQIHFTESDGGHFIGRQHLSTRYDERNTYAQCRKCNRFEYGRQYEFSKMIGEDLAEELLQKSRQIVKWCDAEWLEVYNEYKSKLEILKKNQSF